MLNFVKIIICILILGVGIGVGFGIDTIINKYYNESSDIIKGQSNNKNINYQKQVPNEGFGEIIKSTKSSVVSVYSEKKIDIRRQLSIMDMFFFDLMNDQFKNQMPSEQIETGIGSGVIISEDGYILTNNHVIAGADEIKVSLYNNKEIKAKIIGADEKTDLALLKIDSPKTDYTYLKFGNSDNISVGDLVLAIGNPFGIGQTVTMGIISAIKRENLGIADYEDFIQTDAAINPGNSGGALVNTKGELIGINTAIYSKSGGYQGIGFAVPINLAKKIAIELKQHGKIIRPVLGVSIIDINKAIESQYPLAKIYYENGYKDGVIILQVKPNGLASKANIKEGMLILEINNTKIKSSDEFIKTMAISDYKTKIKLKILSINLKDGKFETKDYLL